MEANAFDFEAFKKAVEKKERTEDSTKAMYVPPFFYYFLVLIYGCIHEYRKEERENMRKQYELEKEALIQKHTTQLEELKTKIEAVTLPFLAFGRGDKTGF